MLPENAYNLRRVLKGMRLGQLLAALVCFVLPLILMPLAHSRNAPLWERVASWPGDQTVTRLAMGNSNGRPLLFAVGAVSGIYMSYDDGATWTRTLRLPYERAGVTRVLDLAINPQTPEEIYAIVASSETRPRPMLHWSADAGQTWQTRSSLGPRRVRGIAFSPTGEALYIATTNEVLRAFVSEQGKDYFIRNESDLARALVADLEPKAEITLVAVNDAVDYLSTIPHTDGVTPRLVYIGVRGRGLRVIGDGVAITDVDDAADSSTDTRIVRKSATPYALCIDPLRPEQVYIGTDRGLYVSQDMGMTWRRAPGLPEQAVLSLAMVVERGALFAGLASGGVWSSHDDGATWTPLGEGMGRLSVFSLGVAYSETPILYAATDHGLWRVSLDRIE